MIICPVKTGKSGKSLLLCHSFLLYFFSKKKSDIPKEDWERLLTENAWNTIELRDNRYNQIIHMVSAANGAEDFYSVEVSKNENFHLKSVSVPYQIDMISQKH